MSNVLPIFRKEMRSYFTSPVAYIVMTVFLIITGWFFGNSLFLIGQASMRNVFSIIPFVFTFFVPALTMRMLAEERKTGTFELLVTMPVSDIEVVLGRGHQQALAVGKTAHDPEIEKADVVVLEHHQIARVHVAVEEAVEDHALEPRTHALDESRLGVDTAGFDACLIVDANAEETLQ